jgi:hypothetical protein
MALKSGTGVGSWGEQSRQWASACCSPLRCRYELAARILLDTLGTAQLEDTMLPEVARRAGCQIGAEGLKGALKKTGYEPSVENARPVFATVPSHVLRDQNREAHVDSTSPLSKASSRAQEGTPLRYSLPKIGIAVFD